MDGFENYWDDQDGLQDFCRVCRSEGSAERPLFHPCLCIGSIKYIHQDCLVQWLKYSKRQYCELCKHEFTFRPIYSADMPARLPLRVLLEGIASSVIQAVTSWLHYTLVAIAWLCVVPLTACRISRCLFTGNVASLVTLPLDLLSTKNILKDCLYGLLVVLITISAFIGYVWLREQILQGGAPEWLVRDQPPARGRRRRNNLIPGLLNVLGVANGVNNFVNVENNDNANDDEMDDANDNINNDDSTDDEEEPAEEVVGPNADDAAQPEPEQAPPVQEDVIEDADAGPRPDDNLGVVAAVVGDGGANNDGDVERVNEELTWERLLGLDGSLVFLEHVFWVVSLNTLFILIFAFCPYHIGHFTVVGFKVQHIIESTHMEGLVTTLIGYVILASILVFLHFALQIGRMHKARRYAGIGYIVIKVALLSVLEIGVFPIVCGLWMDICSMGMFNATLSQRASVFTYAPATFLFMHWMVGMMYVFYFASFLLLLKDVLRPGIFWFIKNFNDPEFNPVHDMIILPVYQHLTRFLINCCLFGLIILLMIWIPVRAIKKFSPKFLPYTFNISQDSGLDYSIEIFFLQVVLPLLFDSQAKIWIKSVVKMWCSGVSWMLGIRSYLLGDEPFKPQDEIVQPDGSTIRVQATPDSAEFNEQDTPLHDLGDGINAAPNGEVIYKTWRRPRYFVARLGMLVLALCLTLMLLSLCILTLPVECGRYVMQLMPIDAKHDLFALLLGLAGLGILVKVLFSIPRHIFRNQDHRIEYQMIQIGHIILIGSKMILLTFLFLIVIPTVLGVLVDLIFITPFRVPLEKSLVIGFLEHWIFGLMHMKAWILLLLVGPKWWMREILEAIQEEILRRQAMRLGVVLDHSAPLLAGLSVTLSGPYVAAKSFAPLLGYDSDFVYRRIYPFVFTILFIVFIFHFQIRQFKRLYEHIKNDRYLVGQRLVNYDSIRNE